MFEVSRWLSTSWTTIQSIYSTYSRTSTNDIRWSLDKSCHSFSSDIRSSRKTNENLIEINDHAYIFSISEETVLNHFSVFSVLFFVMTKNKFNCSHLVNADRWPHDIRQNCSQKKTKNVISFDINIWIFRFYSENVRLVLTLFDTRHDKKNRIPFLLLFFFLFLSFNNYFD